MSPYSKFGFTIAKVISAFFVRCFFTAAFSCAYISFISALPSPVYEPASIPFSYSDKSIDAPALSVRVAAFVFISSAASFMRPFATLHIYFTLKLSALKKHPAVGIYLS